MIFIEKFSLRLENLPPISDSTGISRFKPVIRTCSRLQLYFSQSKIDLKHKLSELGLIGITSLRMPSVFLIISETTFACTSAHVSIFMLHNAYLCKTFESRTS